MSTVEADRLLGEPLLTSPGQPLRVAVYSRISQGIRSGALVSGSVLPREIVLGEQLGVSRTVVREALMLLEEDGLIVTKRGIGRFVADLIPHQVPEEFLPLEFLLAEVDTALEVELIEFTLQTASDFVVDHLDLSADDEFWFRECIVRRDGQPIALVQEYVPDEKHLAMINADVAHQLMDAAAQRSTLLHSITTRVGQIFTMSECRIAANVAGPTRATHLGIKAADPLLVLTQIAQIEGVPAYISKCALPPAFGHLAVPQWTRA